VLQKPRTRALIEAALAAISTLLLILTFAWPEWIEGIFGVDPDGASGELEWVIATGCLAAAIGFALLARRDARIAYERAGGE
jgi:hypothetical protein